MEKRTVFGERASEAWISAYRVDERLREHVEGAFSDGMLPIIGGRTLPRAAVADYAWKVTAGTAEERDEIAGHLTTALRQFSAPDSTCDVYYADQWAAGEDGQWWGELYFAVSGVDRAETELQRCAAREVANAFLQTENSPYRLQ